MKLYQISYVNENEQYVEKYEDRYEAIQQFRLCLSDKETSKVKFEEVEDYLEEENYMQMKDAAALLGVRYQQIYQKIQNERISSKDFEGKTFVRTEEILQWYDERLIRSSKKNKK